LFVVLAEGRDALSGGEGIDGRCDIARPDAQIGRFVAVDRDLNFGRADIDELSGSRKSGSCLIFSTS
jgi:hypothetical protein